MIGKHFNTCKDAVCPVCTVVTKSILASEQMYQEAQFAANTLCQFSRQQPSCAQPDESKETTSKIDPRVTNLLKGHAQTCTRDLCKVPYCTQMRATLPHDIE
jgi:hypothetical protein